MSSSNCCFLTCIQVSQKAGQVIWYSHLFQNFPQFIVIHTVKGFGIVHKAESGKLKSLLVNVKEENKKVGLKLYIQKTKIMISSPITSWQIDGATMETVTDFIFGAPKSLQMVMAAMKLRDTCSFGRKATININSISKSRNITLPTKICIVRAMAFPLVMYRCESWTIKGVECRRIYAFYHGVGEDS